MCEERLMIIFNGSLSTSTGPGTSFTTWDQTTESGWTGMTGVNICLLENTSAGGDEDSVGLVSAPNLTYTETGTLAGAVLSGGRYSRVFDGIDDYLSVTQTLADTLKSRDNFLIVGAFKAFTAVNTRRLLQWYGDVGGNNIYVQTDATGHLLFYVDTLGGNRLNATTTDAVPAATDFLLWVGADGTNTFGGWHTARPTTHTGVAATQRVQAASAGQFSGVGFDLGSKFMSAYEGSAPATGTIYYLMISQTLFITY